MGIIQSDLSIKALDPSMVVVLKKAAIFVKEKKKKRKEKEEKREGEREELIFQAWFEHLKYFKGCNFHPRNL